MTISMRCVVCRNEDLRRAVELMHNGGMTHKAISNVLDNEPSTAQIDRHINEHSDGNAKARAIEIRPERTVRERVLELQRMQLDEFERRIELAKARADELNAALDALEAAGAEGADKTPRHDWSEFVDILGKDMQAAIGSILKTQGLSDKREKAQGDLKLGLFEAMANAGLAPKALVGDVKIKVLGPGEDDDEA